MFLKIYFLMMPFALLAQSNLTSGGGEFKGEGGSISQSFGQLSYTSMHSDEISI